MKDEKAKKDVYEKALSAYSEAVREFRKGKVEKAKELFAAFPEKYDSEKELVDRSRMYLAVIQEKGKKEAFPPKSAEDYYQHGVYKMNMGDFEGALKSLEKALEMNAEEGKVFYLMADLHCLKGDAETALEYLKKAIQKDKFFRTLAQNEIDFEPLWEDKKFKLITRMI